MTDPREVLDLEGNNKATSSLPLDRNEQSQQVFNPLPDSIVGVLANTVIDVSDPKLSMIIFEGSMGIQFDGAGLFYQWPANKELGVTNLTSITVDADAEYMLV